MNRWLARTLAVAALCVSAQSAFAQAQIGQYTAPNVNPRPRVSPYLNLSRPGVGGGINYYNLVKPQMETQRNLLDLQSEYKVLQGVQQQQLEDPTTGTLTTQAPAQSVGGYFNYMHYYPMFNRQGAGAITPGQVGGVRR